MLKETINKIIGSSDKDIQDAKIIENDRNESILSNTISKVSDINESEVKVNGVSKTSKKEGFDIKKDFATSIVNGNIIVFQIFGYFTKYPVFIKNSDIDGKIASAIKDIKNDNVEVNGVEITDNGLLLKCKHKDLSFSIVLNGDSETVKADKSDSQ